MKPSSTSTAARPGLARNLPRAALALLVCLASTSCAVIYRLPTRQGNVIEQSEFDRVKIGMTKDQVQYILGTPIAADPFRRDRWDYYGYYKSPRGRISQRNIALFFDGDDKLTRMEGEQIARNSTPLGTPDMDAMQKQKAKEKVEDTRADREAGVKMPAP